MSRPTTEIFKEVRRTASRQGRKGHLYRAEPVPHAPTPEEEVRIIKRRVQKAERDERMDITLALTPPKTWMGGFTRPRDIRAANWFPGGPYVLKNKFYESPHHTAYEPHTVFLLETRHRVRHGVGRVNAKDHIVAVCRAADFVKLVEKYNSAHCPHDAKESMDNACWPWLPKSGKVLRPTRWWGKDEKLEDIMKEIYEDENYTSPDVQQVLKEAEEEVEEEEPQGNVKPKEKFIPLEAEPKVDLAQQDTASTTTPESDSHRHRPPHLSDAPPSDAPNIRSLYMPRLATEPFWRPLLAVTLSTRPLALTVARLSKGLERGLPFYASMVNHDRKCLHSFSNRMTSMRLDRMRQLTLETVSRLAGHKGGFIGIRFATDERGRGVGGSGLANPVPPEKRIVKVQLGNWLYRAQEEAELYQGGAEQWGGTDALDMAMMNEWGRRLDADGNEVPLTEAEMSTDEVQVAEDDEAEVDAETDQELDEEQEKLLLNPMLPGERKRWKFKPELATADEASAALRRKLAYRLGSRHRSVVTV